MPCFIRDAKPKVEIEFGRLYKRDGGLLFMCGANSDDIHCSNCADVGDYLCDYPIGDGKTCDRGMCDAHRHNVAPEVDYCALHYPEWEKFRDSGAVLDHFRSVIPFRGEKIPR